MSPVSNVTSDPSPKLSYHKPFISTMRGWAYSGNAVSTDKDSHGHLCIPPNVLVLTQSPPPTHTNHSPHPVVPPTSDLLAADSLRGVSSEQMKSFSNGASWCYPVPLICSVLQTGLHQETWEEPRESTLLFTRPCLGPQGPESSPLYLPLLTSLHSSTAPCALLPQNYFLFLYQPINFLICRP